MLLERENEQQIGCSRSKGEHLQQIRVEERFRATLSAGGDCSAHQDIMGAMSLEVKKVGEVLERDVEECRTQIKASQEQHEGGSCVEEQGSMVVVDVEHGGRCDGNDDHDLSKELKTAGWLGTNVYVPPDVAPLLPASLMCSSGKEHPNAIACPPCDADGTLKYENGFNNSNPAFCGGLTSCAVNVRRSDTLLTLPTAGAAADLLQLPQAAPPAHKNPSPTSKFMIPLSSVSPALLPITATTTADLGKSSVYFFSKFAAADNDKPVAKEHAIQPLTDADKLKVIHLSSDPPTVGKSTFFQATLNCLSLLYGLGVLSSPFAVAKTGWMGVVVSVMLSTAYAYAAYLMARCVDFDPACSNYQDIAKLTLGTRMRKLINALFYMELTGTLMGYCISMGDNLDYIFPHVGFGLPGMSNRNFMICIVVLIILPSVWLRDLSALSFTSLWCIISSILLLVAVLLAATVNHIGFKHPIPLLHIKGVPVAAGLYAFSYGGTSVFPSIYKSMKEPRRFPQVLLVSFFIATVSFAGLGVAGAYMFGFNTASQVTLSMPVHLVTSKIVLWMTILTPIFKFALQLSPITTAVDGQVYKRCKNIQTKSQKTLLFGLSTILRSCVLVLIAIASMILPYFEYIIALVGSSMTIGICMIFPCLFYLKLYWKRLPSLTIAFITCLISLGLIVGACGTLVAFQGLIRSRTTSQHG